MNDILLDLTVFFEILLKQNTALAVWNKLISYNYQPYLSSSSIPQIEMFITKHKIDRSIVQRELLTKIKFITNTGKEARESINYFDCSIALSIISFKRIAPYGIVLSNNKRQNYFGLRYFDIQEFLFYVENNNLENVNIPMLDLKAEYRFMMEDIDHSLSKMIVNDKYILGPQVKELENTISNYLESPYAIGCSSGTDAIVLSLRAFAIKLKAREYFDKSDYIITTPFTFIATASAILRSGATPVFIDIDPKTLNIDTQKLSKFLKKMTLKVIGIIPVHLFGGACQMDDIQNIAKENKLFILEDVAQAFGGSWNNKKLGSLGDAGSFSFYPSKNLGGFGDAGMVITSDKEVAQLVSILAKHGENDKNNTNHIGYNARLDTMQAAILLDRIKHIDFFIKKRIEIAESYSNGFSNIPQIEVPKSYSKAHHVYNQYTIKVPADKRDALQDHLANRGISTKIYYPLPLHKMKVFNERCYIFEDLVESESASKEVLSIPIGPVMREEEVITVINEIRYFFN
ncbi:MAG: DegT/DnrJ/EryC1/StrS family aminotransferase [Spirochaetota bacterium]|nr:DegT/DnrJ/EryC1/StrS family aminotransferase [Spirochaetota bacterium]